MRISEHDHQKTVVSYCKAKKIPVVAIPNAQALSFLNRDAAMRVVAKLKAEGMAKGFPDILIPLVSNNKSGLFIEMKSSNGRVSPEQKEWIYQLNNSGYKAAVCYGADEAIKTIDEYVKNA
ncbi:VRR-NUC domain-containing protein [Fangia hongkongensis]|uniref:VRR-NUC domain-containing protein n=1 Tax=Fangia hongkongensis TaxID=270495 RepID=UPI00037019A1|nr:VRR-NUC domain-containing protein [Fangia hongkongensis]MBK2126253.1 VRR-NUC domain-containing protein [Fangia hongkongensis]